MMAFPPFPPQDLAKLVLGYLAEEELMTAYDEFLQASPYLDAFRNEYDRIFMTSLRSILADYRAVKIYVETCKPHLLRKKLLQCTNLLEIVKFLISLIDLHKLCSQDQIEKNSFQKTNSMPKVQMCEVCYSSNFKTCVCVCTSKISTTSVNVQSSSEEHSIPNNSLVITSLKDLPGKSFSKSKHKPQAETNNSNLVFPDQKDFIGQKQDTDTLSSTSVVPSTYNVVTSVSHNTNPVNSIPVMTKASCMDSKQKIEEFNNILNLVCNKSVTNDKLYDNLVSNTISNRVSNVENFQDFANGVFCGSVEEKVTRVPDSSTTEMSIPIAPIPAKETFIANIKGPPNKIIYQPIINLTGSTNSNYQNITTDISQTKNTDFGANKVTENKIRILSDVKFDKNFPCGTMPPVLRGNSTSTPSLPKQTLLINGTPAYKQMTPTINSYNNYSKDEIMAMPTLIVVPTSGSYSIVSRTTKSTSNKQRNKSVSTSEASAISPKRRPIFIEVPTVDVVSSQSNQKPTTTQASDVGLVKTVDTVSHASLPKDNTVLSKASTPQVLPPLRKSSSTPRRTSHVRVLDFATPRRILNEPIPEKDIIDDDVVVLSDSPVHSPINTVPDKDTVPINNIVNKTINTELNKEQKLANKRNWDEGLRALVASNEDLIPSFVSKPTKKKKTIKNKSNQNTDPVTQNSRKESTKVKKYKKKIKSAEYIEEPKTSDLRTDKPIKPTINIISSLDHGNPSVQEDEKKLNKSFDIENQIDTPENDRLSLQNVIGVKLNISDLLETPYKQAIYDIQMETPRFLGPDIPGEPISDIKIMNIPTPRFFDTPKPIQATPSSYSSRPTDYSSGGSYYKPDDQDYVPITEVAECTITESKNKNKVLKSTENSQKETTIDSNTEVKSTKTRRPIRKCAKNVSYYNSPNLNNLTKPDNGSFEEDTKTSSTNVSRDKNFKPVRNKSAKPKTTKAKVKHEKYKSPFKKENPKTFMKIKPRRVTPIKHVNSKNRGNVQDVSMSAKKKNVKEKYHNISPLVTLAPTKSRRKSSTPRKLHCNKTFNLSTSSNTSPDIPKDKKTEERKEVNICVTHDSDSEQQPLRWSDDGSQDARQKDSNECSAKEGEDIIVKIQEYIETIENNKNTSVDISSPPLGMLQNDLVKRGFDLETAKIIERDLLDTPPIQDGVVQSTSNDTTDGTIYEKKVVNETDNIGSSVISPIKIPEISKEQDETDVTEENDDIDFDVKETNEDTNNYFVYHFDETNHKPNTDIVKLKDKFSMEVCIDDGVSIRLRATQFSVVLDQEPVEDKGYDKKELESAITSISNIEKLYTPIKDPRVECYEIFDSTLTSLDTPLKATSPKHKGYETSVNEIVLEVENISGKMEGKKRKRVQSAASDEGSSTNKRTKSDTPYLLHPASIQNIDIESVLSKLHGP